MPDPQHSAFAREERANLTFMVRGRAAVLALMAIWVAVTLPAERSVLYLAVILTFLLSGIVPVLIARRGYGSSLPYALCLFLDAGLLSYILIVPNPYGLDGWSPQMNLRGPGFLYLGIFLAYMSLSYRPAHVIWAGIAAILSWSMGYFWVASRPDTLVFLSRDVLDAGLRLEAALDLILDPAAVGVARWVNQIVFLIAVTLILTLAVWRSRNLVHRQMAVERERAALSRYFSPNIVNELTQNAQRLNQPRLQPVAVLFADMKGFTEISEQLTPVELLNLLRAFHGRLARQAIAHGGTIDKYIGDAIMVHFGTPDPRPDDAVRALTCAARMIEDIKDWNRARDAAGQKPICVGIGLHYGEVIVGNIGDAQRLEYTVLGDTVNVANRLEELTRRLKTSLVTSDALIQAIRDEGVDPSDIAPNLTGGKSEPIRGRATPVKVWFSGSAEEAKFT
ncbi:adenylate/guanylate cyclase domain-containing protein [Ruegeria sp. HKCCD4884]|uniref:adenylate/guanylate cyclase domain-containing protein n=1 Tax=Ruegeria sp. HKCCD4884 TaxID=2683022 RepID=UPI001492D364|nr:adenylate/guanylate cyclase domain-containing protein [Ruegeria sp. HKCCD4884]NOD94479.1 adenylate/guanylate cyclase domain-containing protein [Ruegeria sp. HKCCD4884]